jgi:hypothetical protein
VHVDWATISSLATAAGTLVLAVATFASIRSANRSARVAQAALMVNTRPLLSHSRFNDPPQKLFFQEGTAFLIEGGCGLAHYSESAGVIYLGLSLRNSGQGVGIIHGWRFLAGRELNPQRPDPASFRVQGIDLVIGAGDLGYWEGALRDSDDPQHAEAIEAVRESGLGMATIDLLYGDHEGGQRVISRMMLRRVVLDDPGKQARWLTTVVRHWNLDRPDPRQR